MRTDFSLWGFGMKGRIFVFLVAVMQSSVAFSTVLSGVEFLDWDRDSRSDDKSAIFLRGYVAGLYDANEYLLAECGGEDISMSTLVDSIRVYLRNNPSKQNSRVADIFVSAFVEEWDCAEVN